MAKQPPFTPKGPLFRQDDQTKADMEEWLAQLIADRAIEKLKAKANSPSPDTDAQQPAESPGRQQ